MTRTIYAFCVLLLYTPFSSAAELTGFAALDIRGFLYGPNNEGQDLGSGPSLLLEPEWYHVSEDDHHTFTFMPFLRYDHFDRGRTHADIRQFDWLYSEDEYEFRAGLSKVFWGVIESRHLVDIINQTDSIEDVDEEDNKIVSESFKLSDDKDIYKEEEFGLSYIQIFQRLYKYNRPKIFIIFCFFGAIIVGTGQPCIAIPQIKLTYVMIISLSSESHEKHMINKY